jgi:hypothetical protein
VCQTLVLFSSPIGSARDSMTTFVFAFSGFLAEQRENRAKRLAFLQLFSAAASLGSVPLN